MVRLENISDNDKLYILHNLEKLITSGYNASLRIDKYGATIQMTIDKDELAGVKEVLGVKSITKSTFNDKSGMYAKAQIKNVEVTIWPRGDVFQGCRIEEEEIEVPEELVPAHKAKVRKVVCSDSKEE